MKLITAFIRPGMADKVTDALRSAGIDGMTILPYSGHGHLIAATEPHYEEKTNMLACRDKTRLEIVCPDADKAVITAVIRVFGNYNEGVTFAILLMNLLVPYINDLTMTKPLGGVTEK